jgi:hypothetical protein
LGVANEFSSAGLLLLSTKALPRKATRRSVDQFQNLFAGFVILTGDGEQIGLRDYT